jgi:hypothetical protein
VNETIAEAMSILLQIEVEINLRPLPFQQELMRQALVLTLRRPFPFGVQINFEELKSIGFSWSLLTRVG